MHQHADTPQPTAASAALLSALSAEPVAPEDLYGPDGSVVYEHFTADDRSEISPLLAAVRRTGGPILELASGGGRLTVPLLGLGRPVVAVDLSPTMIDILRSRIATLPAARIAAGSRALVGDMTCFHLPERFGAVVLGATSIALLDRAGRQAFLRVARAHLADGGVLLITASTAGHAYVAGSRSSRVRAVPGPCGGPGAAVVTSAVTPDGLHRDVEVVQLGADADGRAMARLFHSRVNVVDADEVSEEAALAGLRVAGRTELAETEDSTLLQLVRS
ncbi:class I SAM-dependent methyltransferase [Rathayibacter sp. VKM Ac-2856]|uniref:daptide-type RiPP biosynthesis methyltransferase n=1 Tax=unclassified Rathayibacter TaxID=2609250 RepID=UPI001564D77C|nr:MULTISPECIES: daptide-type RiPP biosynthesis methyltransferase [unclassified Rathayibacter]NQX04200.1 class I SAM-dependent methyltransferase [Rathayibacter sp. VKM Ac-2858]NQX19369.1 class I SAM-dependent methyltransferase [Rathayibacter sp. VKM Ac-2856]